MIFLNTIVAIIISTTILLFWENHERQDVDTGLERSGTNVRVIQMSSQLPPSPVGSRLETLGGNSTVRLVRSDGACVYWVKTIMGTFQVPFAVTKNDEDMRIVIAKYFGFSAKTIALKIEEKTITVTHPPYLRSRDDRTENRGKDHNGHTPARP